MERAQRACRNARASGDLLAKSIGPILINACLRRKKNAACPFRMGELMAWASVEPMRTVEVCVSHLGLLGQVEKGDALLDRPILANINGLRNTTEEASTMPRLPLAVKLWIACNLAAHHIHSRQFPCT